MLSMDDTDILVNRVTKPPYYAWQKRSELPGFIAFLRTIPLTAIAEIGVDAGGLLPIYSKLADGHALIIGVDRNAAEAEHARKTLSVERPGQTIVLVNGESAQDSTVQQVRAALGQKQLDFLFIDADHHYEPVKTDYFLYERLVRPGGWIGFHDILKHHPRHTHAEVDRFWAEVKIGKNYHEIIGESSDLDRLKINYGPWGGFGLIQKSG